MHTNNSYVVTLLFCCIDRRYPGAIQQLYVGIGCSSCGLRFKSETADKKTEHLDWHFRQNRREKEELKVAKNRQWYYDIVVCAVADLLLFYYVLFSKLVTMQCD